MDHQIPEAIPVERGCGKRKADGVYWECGMGSGPGAAPVEEFFFDSPLRVPTDYLEHLPHIGMHWFERHGVWHLVDRIGLEHYPNPSDLFEEIKRFGLSRRLPSNLDFSRLTAESRLLLVHDRGYIENARDWIDDWACPQRHGHHQPSGNYPSYEEQPCCIGMWWYDIEDGESGEGLRVTRRLPSFQYSGKTRPEWAEPDYSPAFVASFPASRLVVIKGDNSLDRLDKMIESAIPTAEVEA